MGFKTSPRSDRPARMLDQSPNGFLKSTAAASGPHCPFPIQAHIQIAQLSSWQVAWWNPRAVDAEATTTRNAVAATSLSPRSLITLENIGMALLSVGTGVDGFSVRTSVKASPSVDRPDRHSHLVDGVAVRAETANAKPNVHVILAY